jgi:hypothetical protein
MGVRAAAPKLIDTVAKSTQTVNCNSDVHFRMSAKWSAATYETGVLETGADFWRAPR